MSRVTTRALLVLSTLCLGLLATAIHPASAFACSCGGITTTTAARNADVIFSGTLEDKMVLHRPAPGRIELRFAVSRVYKGDVYQEQVVTSPLGADGCSIDPQLNSNWVIFAVDQIEGSGNRAVIRSVTGLCSGNLPTSTPPGVLGSGQLPLQGASDRGEKAATTDAAITRGLIIGGIAVGIVALAVGAGLALLWRRQPS